MGGIDQSPSGYRVVTFEAGTPTIVGRERLVAPHLAAIAPGFFLPRFRQTVCSRDWAVRVGFRTEF
jgi:hypothetical protein